MPNLARDVRRLADGAPRPIRDRRRVSAPWCLSGVASETRLMVYEFERGWKGDAMTSTLRRQRYENARAHHDAITDLMKAMTELPDPTVLGEPAFEAIATLLNTVPDPQEINDRAKHLAQARGKLPAELAYAVDAFAAITLDYIASVMRQHPTEEWRKVARADVVRTISNVLVDPIGHGITTPEQNDQDRWDDYKLQMGEPIN